MNFVAPVAFAPISPKSSHETGSNILVDAAAVTGWTAIGGSGYSGANVSLCYTDFHTATSDQPFTLSVYAYPISASTSFWYAGGIGPSDDTFGDGFE
jgi:hypothetical protein